MKKVYIKELSTGHIRVRLAKNEKELGEMIMKAVKNKDLKIIKIEECKNNEWQ